MASDEQETKTETNHGIKLENSASYVQSNAIDKSRNESLESTFSGNSHNQSTISDTTQSHNPARTESLDISLSSSLDHIVNGTVAGPGTRHRTRIRSNSTISILQMNMGNNNHSNVRKESDTSALLALAGNSNMNMGIGRRKESVSDASAGGFLSISSIRKDSDVSALSALVKDEEEMMQHDEDMVNIHGQHHDDFAERATPTHPHDDEHQDPFENLRKLSDASDAVSALRKMSEESDPLKSFRKDSDGSELVTMGSMNMNISDLKSPESGMILGEMKETSSREDDASASTVHLFVNPNPHSASHKCSGSGSGHNSTSQLQPTPVFKKSSGKYTSLALEHLDMLGSDNSDDDGSSSTATMNEANQKLLMEAMLGSGVGGQGSSGHVNMNVPIGRNRAESWGGMSDISANQMARIESLASAADVSTMNQPTSKHANHNNRAASPSPHGGFEGVIMSPRSQSQDSLTGHLQQVQGEEGYHGYVHKKMRRRSRSRSGSVGLDPDIRVPDKIRVPAPTPLIKGRERLDSLSGMGLGNVPGTTRERLDSVTELHLLLPRGTGSGGRERSGSGSFSRERLDSWTVGGVRDRKDSIATMATRDRLDSLANLSGIFSKGRDRLDSLASLGEVSLTMSLGDLEDVAGKLESIVHGDESDTGDSTTVDGSEHPTTKKIKGSLPAPTIQVDSEAVQSAVQAAMAATSGGILDMLQINTPAKINKGSVSGKVGNHNAPTPLMSNASSKPIPVASNDDIKMEEIRARAREAAGYVHPGTECSKIIKSRKRPLPTNSLHSVSKRPAMPTQFSTPIALPKLAKSGRSLSTSSGTGAKRKPYSKSPASSSKGGQSNQKWDEMFDCLVSYVKEQRAKETGGMSEADAKKWEWSGNVPTMYKTADGKALGRWINNQRSAKSKGSLKPEREQRLVSTGLKWSVLTTNAWTDMMEELKLYVKEKTKDGKQWDGNVPTNYKIKNSTGTEIEDEDKNLGRWINRQRSLYQSGKLKDERRKQLEVIGLKWAVLSTTSWHTMYESLVKYANEKREADKNRYWDGNVPASYETDDKPPKKLGRWVNRQRSAYANKKLKKEFVEKLEMAGLKWTAMDSKKDLENSEVLMRQRALMQAQRPIIRTVPQIGRPGVTTVRPVVAGSRPTPAGARTVVTTSGVRVPVQATTRPGTRPLTVMSGGRPDTQGTMVARPGATTGARTIVPGTPGPRPITVVSGLRPIVPGTVGVRPVTTATTGRAQGQTTAVGARPVTSMTTAVRQVASGTGAVATVIAPTQVIQGGGTAVATSVATKPGHALVPATIAQKQVIKSENNVATSTTRVLPSTTKVGTTIAQAGQTVLATGKQMLTSSDRVAPPVSSAVRVLPPTTKVAVTTTRPGQTTSTVGQRPTVRVIKPTVVNKSGSAVCKPIQSIASKNAVRVVPLTTKAGTTSTKTGQQLATPCAQIIMPATSRIVPPMLDTKTMTPKQSQSSGLIAHQNPSPTHKPVPYIATRGAPATETKNGIPNPKPIIMNLSKMHQSDSVSPKVAFSKTATSNTTAAEGPLKAVQVPVTTVTTSVPAKSVSRDSTVRMVPSFKHPIRILGSPPPSTNATDHTLLTTKAAATRASTPSVPRTPMSSSAVSEHTLQNTIPMAPTATATLTHTPKPNVQAARLNVALQQSNCIAKVTSALPKQSTSVISTSQLQTVATVTSPPAQNPAEMGT